MTIHVRSVLPRLHLSVFAGPAPTAPCRPESDGISGPALSIAETRSAVSLALLQARRLALLAEGQRLRNQRRSKAASTSEGHLRRVTLDILAMGEME